MNKAQAIQKYGSLHPIIKKYRDADEYFMVNENDPDLHPIKIPLPEPPDWTKIDGFGLEPHEQYFRPPKIPDGLKRVEQAVKDKLLKRNLENRNERITGQKIRNDIIEFIGERKQKFLSEIEWIRKMWYYREHGYWFFNNGQPTYIDGWHFFYCSFWTIDVGLPDYRDKDRRFMLFLRHAYTTTKDIFGNEYNFRTCVGVVNPKGRRGGLTNQCLCVEFCIVTDGINRLGGIQSFDDDNARKHFQEKLIPAFQKLPFFFKPLWQGFDAPKESLVMSRPLGWVLGDELGGKIDFADTSKKKIYYDGVKLHALLRDEGGKSPSESVDETWDVLVHCFSQGKRSNFHGLAMFPSTVAEMSERGGKAYWNLASKSHANKASPDQAGQTMTGLWNVFFPAYDGLENFIDRHGMSVIDTPTPEQAKFIKRNVGAKEYLTKSRQKYLLENTPESLTSYRKECSEYPLCWADCWRSKEGNLGFDYEKLDKNIARLQREEALVQEGDLEWASGVDSHVVWIPKAGGKFIKSWNFDLKQTNRRYKENGHYYPEFPDKGICGSDPYGFLQTREFVLMQKDEKDFTKKAKQSNGGLAAFMRRDKSVDTDTIDIADWKTNRFIMTYQNRPLDDDEFAEDALMMCVYTGYLMNTETNKELVWKHFIKRGYAGYLYYEWDEKENAYKERPGIHESKESKQRIFRAFDKYIKKHSDRERHLEILQDLKDIKGVEQMTKFDRLTACGLCLIAADDTQFEMMDNSGKDLIELTDGYYEEFDVE